LSQARPGWQTLLAGSPQVSLKNKVFGRDTHREAACGAFGSHVVGMYSLDIISQDLNQVPENGQIFEVWDAGVSTPSTTPTSPFSQRKAVQKKSFRPTKALTGTICISGWVLAVSQLVAKPKLCTVQAASPLSTKILIRRNGTLKLHFGGCHLLRKLQLHQELPLELLVRPDLIRYLQL
jgi:hypothetical protein